MKKYFYLIGILAVLIVVAGCSTGPGYGGNKNVKYYQGYDSLDIRLIDNSPPNIFYFDSTDAADNELPIVVRIQNKGSSLACGALYIQGFDPNFVQISGGKLPDANTGSYDYKNGQLVIGGVFVGLSGRNPDIRANVGWQAPDGNFYGAGVFMQDGKVVSMNVRIDLLSRLIGVLACDEVFNMLNDYWGWNSVIALEGDTPETPGGGLEVYEFPAYFYALPQSLENFRQNLMVTACYSYSTRATANICVDPRPNSQSKKACIARDVSMSGGQGAPITVTRVEQRATTNKVVFIIYIHHNKKNALDDIYDLRNLWKCNPESGALVKETDKNVVFVRRIALSGQQLVCSPDYWVRLDQAGNGQISCTAITEGAESAHNAPLEIELDYGYQKNIYKEITVRQI
ncbi:TPA: hypothetical protein HA235_01095 [Candidatus Woesearchaeota archaeon]|nr:hypothetical protein [Candidatus Woesearchaeota archaeon]HIH31280.1 hypothetical protein [Candidatus Woesearchaeota archaeon]HIH54492.1 hypothetical protein [Candidatus Woesearchaeota archaeon]HIJ02003.1 hypothetical protein [Candidatus Woesearchaeota archaeon]HIJ14496.1 hypothetical protein [Candidatus Woesearchaeota archaeon]